MKIVLESVRQPQPDRLGQAVIVSVDGTPRTFTVYRRTDVGPLGMLHADPLLEELLRCNPRALSLLLRTVSQHSKAARPASLPLVLVDEPSQHVSGEEKPPQEVPEPSPLKTQAGKRSLRWAILLVLVAVGFPAGSALIYALGRWLVEP